MKKQREISEIEFEQIFLFLKAVENAKLQKGEHKTIICPICGGEIEAYRAESNGHHHANCVKCGRNLHV